MLSTIPCSGFLYLQFLARCHPYILISFLMIFTLVRYTSGTHQIQQHFTFCTCRIGEMMEYLSQVAHRGSMDDKNDLEKTPPGVPPYSINSQWFVNDMYNVRV